jgi:ribose transport system substrate-binding protein
MIRSKGIRNMSRYAWILPLAALIPACASSKPTIAPASNWPKVAFVSNNPDQFWSIVEAGCNKAGMENAVDVIFKKPSSGNAAEQKEIIDSLIGQNIKAISVSVIDPNNQTAYLDEVAAKVPLLAVDNDAPKSKRRCYIGTDNYAAGRAAGKLVKEAMPEGGVVSLFVGQTEALNARQRCQGVLDELADAPNLPDPNNVPPLPTGSKQYGKYKLHKIDTDQPGGEQICKEKATNAMIELDKEPNVCFVGLWAYNPPAILSAVTDQKKLGKVKIVGFDENPVTLDGVEAGSIVGTIVQDPFNFGYESVKAMAALAKGQADTGPAVRAVPHRVVTKSGGEGRLTVQDYRIQERMKVGKGAR